MAALPCLRLRPPPIFRHFSSPPPKTLIPAPPKSKPAIGIRCLVTMAASSFTWDDVFAISQGKDADYLDDLEGLFQKVHICNRGSLHETFKEFLERIYLLGDGEGHNDYIALHLSLKSPDERTEAVGEVIRCLGEEVIPGIRKEAYGVHMNGYVSRGGQKFLWIGKRSGVKPTYPGMLDHLVAGGLPHGISCKENLLKECEEEAGIARSIANAAVPVGAVSYMDIDGYRFKRDVLFCYDLQLPDGFVPCNQDGEVESFKLVPLTQVANIIRRTEFFKPNCALVIMDFLFRHGYISPDNHGYLQLLQSLRSGDCS